MSVEAPPVQSDESEIRYVGFWARLLATLIDSVLFVAITLPPLYLIYGSAYFTSTRPGLGMWEVLINYVLPAIAVVLFWRYRSATPGKMLIKAIIVDERTGAHPSTAQLIGRYFAYIPSILVLGLGFLWVAWDPKKQAWHDKLAGTVVIRRAQD